MKRVIASEVDIIKLVEADEQMMKILKAAEAIDLPGWWIGAGFLRNKVWNAIEGRADEPARDIDFVYFNKDDVTKEADTLLDDMMNREYPFAEWEVRNQARMHEYSGLEPFASTEDGIAHWVETATCVAVKIEDGELKLLFCYGIDDLLNLTARCVEIYDTPERVKTFYNRVESKGWKDKWPNLKVIAKTSLKEAK